MKRGVSVAVLVATLLLPLIAHAAAWTVAPGKFELYKNFFYYSTSEYFDALGRKQPQQRYQKLSVNPYMEYGLKEGSTIGVSWGVDVVQGSRLLRQNPDIFLSGNNYGISDPEMHFRQRVLENGPYVLSVQPLLKFPSQFDSGFLPHAGSKSWDAELRGLAGMSFDWLGQSHFVNLETAYRKRFSDPSDQWNSSLAVGFRLGGGWMIIPELTIVQNLGEDSNAFTQSGEDDYDLLKGQFSAVYAFSDRISLQLGAFSHLDGKNTGAGNGAMLSIWYRP